MAVFLRTVTTRHISQRRPRRPDSSRLSGWHVGGGLWVGGGLRLQGPGCYPPCPPPSPNTTSTPLGKAVSDTCGLCATFLKFSYPVCRVGIIFVFILWLRNRCYIVGPSGASRIRPRPKHSVSKEPNNQDCPPPPQLLTLREEAFALSPHFARE